MSKTLTVDTRNPALAILSPGPEWDIQSSFDSVAIIEWHRLCKNANYETGSSMASDDRDSWSLHFRA